MAEIETAIAKIINCKRHSKRNRQWEIGCFASTKIVRRDTVLLMAAAQPISSFIQIISFAAA